MFPIFNYYISKFVCKCFSQLYIIFSFTMCVKTLNSTIFFALNGLNPELAISHDTNIKSLNLTGSAIIGKFSKEDN